MGLEGLVQRLKPHADLSGTWVRIPAAPPARGDLTRTVRGRSAKPIVRGSIPPLRSPRSWYGLARPYLYRYPAHSNGAKVNGLPMEGDLEV